MKSPSVWQTRLPHRALVVSATCCALRRISRGTFDRTEWRRATASCSGAKIPASGSPRSSAAFFAAPWPCPWTRSANKDLRGAWRSRRVCVLAVIGRDLPRIGPACCDHRARGTRGTARAIRCRLPFAFEPAGASDPVEIVFTSGTTAEPRGVVFTHGNLLANLEPIEKEIERYRRYERIVHPLRFLDLLPLSHVFGQLLGIFLPQILGATSVFRRHAQSRRSRLAPFMTNAFRCWSPCRA